MKLMYISPITDENFERESKEEAVKYVSEGTVIDVRRVPYGTASIEGAVDEALAQPGILKVGMDAEAEGYDGIFVSCMGDPGVNALREAVDIPVVGPCRTTMLYCADIASRFSVLTVTDGVVPIIETIAHEVGVASKLASCKAVNIPVLELVDIERTVDGLYDLAIEAIEKYDAGALMLGCTGMIGVDQKLRDRLLEKGYDVPVLYPVPITIRYLETMVKNGLSQSRMTYPKPLDKERSIWKVLNG